MKWAIVLLSTELCGGINVVFQHALYAMHQGAEVTIVGEKPVKKSDVSWHPEATELLYKVFDDCKNEIFDAVIVTSWDTAYYAFMLNAKRYIYFVQAIESQFYEDKSSIMSVWADMTYTMPFHIITEATWIKNYLFERYNHCADLVLNGIRKDLYFGEDESYEKRSKGKLRVLIEGPVTDWRKNILRTVELCKRSNADEIWLLTSSDIKSYEGVDRVYSKIPADEVSKIYRSCDVLVKLSLAEGMFGPPLEMFHCGGTAIVYDIPGSEEYIINGKNAFVVGVGEDNKVIECINRLKKEDNLLENLKKNALKTARAWRDWDISSKEFYLAVCKTENISLKDLKLLREQTKNGFAILKAFINSVGLMQSERKILNIIRIAKEKNLKIVIYGAGKVATGLIHQLNQFDMPIDGVVVTTLENNPHSILGHPVRPVQEYLQTEGNYLLIIGTNKYRKEIQSNLKKLGFENIY